MMFITIFWSGVTVSKELFVAVAHFFIRRMSVLSITDFFGCMSVLDNTDITCGYHSMNKPDPIMPLRICFNAHARTLQEARN